MLILKIYVNMNTHTKKKQSYQNCEVQILWFL